MKTGTIILLNIIFLLSGGDFTDKEAYGAASQPDIPTKQAQLANCLTEKGWVLYSSFTCSACRAQRKAFGKAFKDIKMVECNPNAPDNQVDLCLKKKIKKTPTWILEENGGEIKRLESYQLLEDLAASAECEF
jgi:hypothetical protein